MVIKMGERSVADMQARCRECQFRSVRFANALCKHCAVAKAVALIGDPEASRRHRRRVARYDITLEEYAALYLGQLGACGICHSPADFADLVVDHDHDTGAVRGLLCGRCNVGIGFLRDNPSVLEAAIEYLTAPPAADLASQWFREKPSLSALERTAAILDYRAQDRMFPDDTGAAAPV